MTEAESNRVCEQGHPIRIGDEFCGQCGARAAGHRRRQTPDGIWQQQGEDGNWYPAEPPTAPRGLLAIERRTGQQVQVLIGLTGGIVGFAGFFVDFFSAGGTTLASASSGWFDLVPILTGIATVALLLPRFRIFSGLGLVSVGIAFGLRGVISGLADLFPHSRAVGYGAGFWMVVIGSAVVAAAGLVLCADLLDLRAAEG